MKQLPLDLGHRPALGREDFLVASSNETAVAWLDLWPKWPQTTLVLHGPPGSGKTHLSHVWQVRSNAVFLTSAALTVDAVPDLLGERQAFILDDAEAANARALLHLYNLIVERRAWLLLIGRPPPVLWPIALPDLRSRLLAAPVVAVMPPDDALLGAVLIKLFADRQIAVGEEVIAYLLARIERSFAAARDIVAALDKAALAAHRPVTVALARQVLVSDVLE